ncbi:hypothetical protein [Sulfurimonas sp. CS5]|jgi:uncharacterized membrane protein|uniref:hypothetical protein n=1 Tax=Sulfurimonas sp. CS5 TaxID=3391145 RepID=UPI0039ED50E1
MTYDFSIIGVLKEGFRRTDGVKLTFVGSIIIYALIALFVKSLTEFIFPNTQSFVSIYASSIVEMLFTLPILIGIMILGVKHAREEELKVASIFDYFGMIIPVMLAYIAMSILLSIGFILLVIPGIYLAISYAFVYTLIVDKGLGVWEAMELSRKTVTQQWFKFFGLSLLSGIIIIISALPFGIGLIWSIPTTYIAYGLLYHRLFDEE